MFFSKLNFNKHFEITCYLTALLFSSWSEANEFALDKSEGWDIRLDSFIVLGVSAYVMLVSGEVISTEWLDYSTETFFSSTLDSSPFYGLI